MRGAQTFDFGNCRVGERMDAENELKGTGVNLFAVADEARVHARVHTLERLQDADRRGKRRTLAGQRRRGPANAADVVARSPQRKQHVGDSGKGDKGGHCLNDACLGGGAHKVSLPNCAAGFAEVSLRYARDARDEARACGLRLRIAVVGPRGGG